VTYGSRVAGSETNKGLASLDALHHTADCLVRYTEVAGDAPQTIVLSSGRDLRPELRWDAQPFRDHDIPPYARTLSRTEQAIRIEEWNQR
jgi:hypothetical protein